VRGLVDAVKAEHPAVVDELIPSALSLGEVQRVLQALLDEGVAIRDLPHIFEGLSLRARAGSDLDGLVEAARGALGPAVASQHAQDGVLRVLTLDPLLEQALADAVRPGDGGTVLSLDPRRAESLVEQVQQMLQLAEERGYSPVLAVAPGLRAPVRRLVVLGVPRLPVLSYSEVGGCGLPIETLGTVSDAHALVA
jgi:flagellar biosynthesis protein FlhA